MIIAFYAFLIGLVLGSFSSVLIHRLHFDEKGILWGRSRCPYCKTQLAPHQLIPLLSWLWQRGKCSACEVRISSFYPLLELIFGLVFFVFTAQFFGTSTFWPLIVSVFFLLILFFYDVRFLEVDRRISWPAIALALGWIFFRAEGWELYALGGIIGFAFYGIQYALSRGKWVGAGDMELGLLLGLLLGWKLTLGALFVAYILGTLVAIPLLITKKATGKTALPMGAFLIPATLLFLYSGDQIWAWYMGFLGI